MHTSQTLDDRTLATLLVVSELANSGKTNDVAQVISAYRRALDRLKERREAQSLAPVYQNY